MMSVAGLVPASARHGPGSPHSERSGSFVQAISRAEEGMRDNSVSAGTWPSFRAGGASGDRQPLPCLKPETTEDTQTQVVSRAGALARVGAPRSPEAVGRRALSLLSASPPCTSAWPCSRRAGRDRCPPGPRTSCGSTFSSWSTSTQARSSACACLTLRMAASAMTGKIGGWGWRP